MNVPEQAQDDDQHAKAPAKVASRPGSMWATGKRTNVKGFTKTAGFARGCRVTKRTLPTTSEKPVK